MLLQIDITGTDASGGVASATIEVEVTEAPAAAPQAAARAGWMSVPPGATAHHETVVTAAEFAAPQVQAERAEPGQPAPATPPHGMRAPQRMARAVPDEAPHVEAAAMDVPIPGLTNSSGHKGAVSTFVPPQVTQAQRSVTLGRFTGGYR